METRIMIVEDEFVIAASIQSVLKKMGYSVLKLISTGEEAVLVAEQQKPDLVLMDISLGGKMDGIEAAHRISFHSDIPVIYLTAHSQDEILERAKITQPFGYLIKPAKEKDLKIAIEIALYKHKMEHQLAEHDRWLNSILVAFEDAVIATNTLGQIQFINQIAAQWIGLNNEHVKGMPLAEAVTLLSHEGAEAGKEETWNESEIGILHMWKDFPFLLKSEGQKIPVEIHENAVYDKHGQVQGRLYIFKDITPLKILQEALHRTRNKFNHLIDHASSAVILCDREANVIDANQNASEILGYSREKLLTLSLSSIELHFNEQEFKEKIRHAALEKPVEMRVVYQRKDHSTFPSIGVMGVWKKRERTIVLFLFRNAAYGEDPQELLHREEDEFNETYHALNQIFSESNHMFKSFDLFEHTKEGDRSEDVTLADENID
ncbi:MAG: PAS domain S-box protein [SAR324 cluster bacterium]|nr:PAS domain S-box protein [SAR324 cluster bacterium]